MLAPIDKIENSNNDIIQIIVTRSCDLHWCSNCTQLLPFRTDAHHMQPEVFRKALRSLEEWPGVRAMFGGNPCSHPKFEQLCEIMMEEVPLQSQRGLWTNNLLGNGEIARKTFWPNGRFNLNTHQHVRAEREMNEWLPGIPILGTLKASWHSPILMHYGDFGISQQDWVIKREQCDLNLRWSGAIAERDDEPWGYFCEVAAALDGIRGVNNGIPATPGWWKLSMDHFSGQVANCCDQGCGIPLKLKGHIDCQETYDVSKSFVQLCVPEVDPINTRPGRVVATHLGFALHSTGKLPESTEIPTDYQGIWSNK